MSEVITPVQARELLAAERQARVDAAKAKYEAFVAEWQAEFRVRLDFAMLATVHGNVPQVRIVAEE